jgi:hypothetical protein
VLAATLGVLAIVNSTQGRSTDIRAAEATPPVVESVVEGIRVNQDTITIDVQDMPLGIIFGEIERHGGVRFEAPLSISEELVSATFDSLPIKQGIKQLLTDYDYMMDRRPSGAGEQGSTLVVHVLGQSTREARQPTPLPGSTASQPEEDPEEAAWQRADELNELTDDADTATVIAAVEQAIHDPHFAVRETALEVVEMMEEEEAPAHLVAEVALRDASPELRASALDVLDLLSETHRDVALATFRQALDDQDEDVRELAQDLIDALEESN